jgi:hypothetical protein
MGRSSQKRITMHMARLFMDAVGLGVRLRNCVGLPTAFCRYDNKHVYGGEGQRPLFSGLSIGDRTLYACEGCGRIYTERAKGKEFSRRAV